MPSALCPYCKHQCVGLPQDFWDRIQCTYCAKMFIAEIREGRARNVTPAMYVLEPPASLDPQLASDLAEACACFNVEAFKATVVMARRFLEALLDKKGFPGKTLVQRIEAAHQRGAVGELQFQLATSTRILGNYGAHFSDDELSRIGQDEAELVLNMVRQILKGLR
jgi:hypothetical protein